MSIDSAVVSRSDLDEVLGFRPPSPALEYRVLVRAEKGLEVVVCEYKNALPEEDRARLDGRFPRPLGSSDGNLCRPVRFPEWTKLHVFRVDDGPAAFLSEVSYNPYSTVLAKILAAIVGKPVTGFYGEVRLTGITILGGPSCDDFEVACWPAFSVFNKDGVLGECSLDQDRV